MENMEFIIAEMAKYFVAREFALKRAINMNALQLLHHNFLSLDKFHRTVCPGDEVNIHPKSTGPSDISYHCTPAHRVSAKQSIRSPAFWFAWYMASVSRGLQKTHPRPKTKSNVLPPPSRLLFSSAASAESIGSSTSTCPDVMTMSPFACSWLSAIIVPLAK